MPQAAERADHFDLLLQWQGALLTWELPFQPLLEDSSTAARRLPDHRLIYLDFSGPLSESRGHVQQVDSGLLNWLAPPEAQADAWTAVLTQSTARWWLRMTAPDSKGSDWVVEWRLLR